MDIGHCLRKFENLQKCLTVLSKNFKTKLSCFSQVKVYLKKNTSCIIKVGWFKNEIIKAPKSAVPWTSTRASPWTLVGKYTLNWIWLMYAYDLCALLVNLRMSGPQLFVILNSINCLPVNFHLARLAISGFSPFLEQTSLFLSLIFQVLVFSCCTFDNEFCTCFELYTVNVFL